jgi:hypothetical protein
MTATELIRTLNLAPHPEGGWYRETYRSSAEPGQRRAATAVYYVIQPGERSRWNRVDADEMWLWHAGDPLDLMIAESDSATPRTVRLGGQVGEGEQPQVIIPKRQWQSAAPVADGRAGYTFLSCIVAPAFDFAGYELAEPGWSPGTATPC